MTKTPCVVLILAVLLHSAAVDSALTHNISGLVINIAYDAYESVSHQWVADNNIGLTLNKLGVAATRVELEDEFFTKEQHLMKYDFYMKSGAWPTSYYAATGRLQDITDYTEDPKDDTDAFHWAELGVGQRRTTRYLGGTYSVPIDGDPFVMYYRRDLISEEDVADLSWEGLVELAKKWNGTTNTSTGEPMYGTCIMTETYNHFYAYTIANTVFRTTTAKNEYFLWDMNLDHKTPMEPLFNTAGWNYTLDIYEQMWKYSQQHRLRNSGTKGTLVGLYDLFLAGRCATTLALGSVGAMTVSANGAYMRGKMGVAPTPGSHYVYDRSAQDMKRCTARLCPYGEYGQLNRPYFTAHGAHLMIRKDAPNLQDVLSFVAYFSVNVDTRKPGALNPFRTSHYDPVPYYNDPALSPAWDKEDAKYYTQTCFIIAQHERTLPNPSLAAEGDVTRVVWSNLHELVGTGLWVDTPASGRRTRAEIMAELHDEIKTAVNAQSVTMRELEDSLRQESGMPLLTTPKSKQAPYWIIPVILFAVIALAVFIGRIVSRHLKVAAAPKEGNFYSVFVSLKNETRLWDALGDTMHDVMDRYHNIVTATAEKHGMYKVKMIGAGILLTSKDRNKVLSFSAAVSKKLSRVRWKEFLDNQPGENKYGAQKEGIMDDTVSERSTDSKHSRRSSRSRSSTAYESNLPHGGPPLDILFSIGIHYDRGMIMYSKNNHAYDYSGPSVDGAARALDRTQPGQMLVSAAVSDIVESEAGEYDLDKFDQFATIEFGRSTLILKQFNPPGLPVCVFQDHQNEEYNVDSILAALEQQASGVTQRRVVVLAVQLPSVTDDLLAASRDDFAELYRKKLLEIEKIAAEHIGSLLTSFGSYVVLSFNASGPTPQAALKAFHTLSEIREHVDANATAGIHAERSITGSLSLLNREHPVIVSNVVSNAIFLESLCAKYNMRTLIFSAMEAEVAVFAETVEYLDFVKTQPGRRPQAVVAVGALKASTDADEWMYTLQKNNDLNPAQPVNTIFEKLSASEPAVDLLPIVRALPEKCQENAGYQNLCRILAQLAGSSDATEPALAAYARANPFSM